MKSINKLILLIGVIFFITGCDTNPKTHNPEVVYETKTVLLTPPQELMKKVVKPQPPNKQMYLNSTSSEKEAILTDLINKQMFIIDEANLTIGKIQSWVEAAKASQLKEVTK